jgi:large subunit ribosomal protein L31
MKKGIHPNYRDVLFFDTAANFGFVTRSTVRTNDTMQWSDGKTYPVVRLDISSASHPFYTGKMKMLDAQGRVDRFLKKFGKYRGTDKAAEGEQKS